MNNIILKLEEKGIEKNKINLPIESKNEILDFEQMFIWETNYTNQNINQLLRICNYYEIDKYIKSSKCKKKDIIDTIIYYENCIENESIVAQRKRLWYYLDSLQKDNKMRQYIIW
jgi:hypothetical protein